MKNRQVKILMIFDTPFPYVLGGGQRRIYEIGKRLTGYAKVDWICFQAWEGDAQITSDDITYIGTRILPELYGDNGNRNAKEPLIFLFDILAKLKSFKLYDTIWVAQWPLIHLVPIMIACKVYNVSLVIDWWEVWSFKNWRKYNRVLGPLGYVIQQVTLLFVKFLKVTLITDNNIDFEKLKLSLGKKHRIFNIPNGIPFEQIERAKIDNRVGYDIVSLGRLKNHKGVDLLIKAVAILVEKGSVNVRVGVIGDGPERENLQSLINELGLNHNIELLGEIDSFEHVYSILSSSNFCALTTHNGGGGNLTLLEAYGCGLPVVAFKVEEGIDENLISEGVSGLFVREVSPEALADVLQRIMIDPNLLSTLKLGAQQFAQSLTWEENAAKYRKIIFDKD